MLTKSLHTVTAAVNVAAYLYKHADAARAAEYAAMPARLSRHALAVLGHEVSCTESDADREPLTIGRIVKACRAIVGVQS